MILYNMISWFGLLDFFFSIEASAPPAACPLSRANGINPLKIKVALSDHTWWWILSFIWFDALIICLAGPPQTTVGLVNPQPKTRAELLKCKSCPTGQQHKHLQDSLVFSESSQRPFLPVHFEPTMDPNTMYRHLQLSDGDRKATMKAENLKPPDHPERFQFWRQVLCREPLGGSPYYWEVEWTGQKVCSNVHFTLRIQHILLCRVHSLSGIYLCRIARTFRPSHQILVLLFSFCCDKARNSAALVHHRRQIGKFRLWQDCLASNSKRNLISLLACDSYS